MDIERKWVEVDSILISIINERLDKHNFWPRNDSFKKTILVRDKKHLEEVREARIKRIKLLEKREEV